MVVLGEVEGERFSRTHPASRRLLERLVSILRRAEWKHFPALRETFPAADYVSGVVIFNVGGNKYRVLASIDFGTQIAVIEKVMTHEQYNREKL